jgi:hypothetical protein
LNGDLGTSLKLVSNLGFIQNSIGKQANGQDFNQLHTYVFWMVAFNGESLKQRRAMVRMISMLQ